MSASRLVVVETSTPRPKGPIAMLASTPSLTSLASRACTAPSVMSVKTTSETCPPNCRPKLPAARV